MHRALLANGGQRRVQRGEEPFLQLPDAVAERRHHGDRNTLAGVHVARGDDTVVLSGRVGTQRLRTVEDGGAALGVDHHQLAEVAVGGVGDDAGQRLLGSAEGDDLVDQPPVKARIGDVLRRGGAHSGAQVQGPGGRRNPEVKGR